MNDRFAPESYEDYLCRGKTSRECAEIRQRLKDADDLQAIEEATKQEDKSETFTTPVSGVGRELWDIFSSIQKNK